MGGIESHETRDVNQGRSADREEACKHPEGQRRDCEEPPRNGRRSRRGRGPGAKRRTYPKEESVIRSYSDCGIAVANPQTWLFRYKLKFPLWFPVTRFCNFHVTPHSRCGKAKRQLREIISNALKLPYNEAFFSKCFCYYVHRQSLFVGLAFRALDSERKARESSPRRVRTDAKTESGASKFSRF